MDRQRSPSKWRRVITLTVGLPLILGVILLAIAVARTCLIQDDDSPVLHALAGLKVDHIDSGGKLERLMRLAGSIKFATVSYEPGVQELDEFLKLHRYLKESYPLVHSSAFISLETVNTHSLLYTVQGSSNASVPYLLAGHLDVVPVNLDTWSVPPFEGRFVDNTFVYGRGAMDCKSVVVGILEALEFMLKKGDRPKRSFYIAFGHDEEVHGMQGAQEIAKRLRARGVRKLDFVVDEGYPVQKGFIPGTTGPIAMVGVSEKGHTTLQLRVETEPGHSSMPPQENAIAILAGAVARVHAHPQPSYFGCGPEGRMFSDLAPHATFGFRLLYGNLWLFSGLLSRILAMRPVSNSMVRTTTAITMFNSGLKENVLPSIATAVINLRVHPCQSIAESVEYLVNVISDPRVVVSEYGSTTRDAHPVSPSGPLDVPYQLVKTTFKQIYPDVAVVPATLIANTDTRWYLGFTDHLFRVYGYLNLPEDVPRYHGNDERMSVDNFHNAVDFYYRLIRNADALVGVVVRDDASHGGEL